MSAKNILTSIDFGSSKVTVVIATFDKSLKNYKLLGYSTVPSQGIRKGIIVDIEAARETLDEALKTAERMAGVPVTQVVASISGTHIESIVSHGVVAVSDPKGDINDFDLERAYESAQAINIPQNRQILYVAPKQFIVDGQAEIKSPVGMTGVRLEVDCNVLTTATTNVKNVEKVLSEVDVELLGLYFGGMASAQAVASEGECELGVCVVDIGASKTDLAVYIDGSLVYAKTLAVGGKHISQDIAVATGLPLDISDELKIYLSDNCKTPAKLKAQDFPDCSKYLSQSTTNEYHTKSLYDEVIAPRLEEIATLIYESLDIAGYTKQIAAGVVLTGGGSHSIGLSSVIQKQLKCPVRVGEISRKLSSMPQELTYGGFATSIGLFYCKSTVKRGTNVDSSFFSGLSGITNPLSRGKSQKSNIFDTVKKFIHQFLP